MTTSDPGTPGPSEIELWEAAEAAHQGMMGLLFAAMKLQAAELRAPAASLPLTVISGFLGSGKTTLLNHLLTEPHGRRLAVLVNDFGRINIDADLVKSRTDDVISLSNGCACCAVAGDMTQALIDLAEREERPDAIVLEASGIADARSIVQTALTNPSIRLEGVVAMVDAETLSDLAEDPHTKRIFHSQLATADLIALSKLDLVDDATRAAAREWLAREYAGKPVFDAVHGQISADVVLGIGASHDDDAGLILIEKDHAHDFESFSFTMDEPLDGERLRAWLASLPKSLLRAKGVLNLAEAPTHRTVYQRVGSRWRLERAEPWGEETPHSNLVFIGPTGALEASTLQTSLDACVASR